MKRIALTGGIACGKSTLAGFLSELGCHVLDTDAVVHALEAPGGAAVQPIVAAFGPEMLTTDGGVDRVRLGRLVFANEADRLRLQEIVHPLVRTELARQLSAPDKRPTVVIIPLLFEVGWDKDWDVVICIVCAETEQRRRLLARGLSEAEAHARMAAQLPLSEKARRSNQVVRNDGDLPALQCAAARLMDQWVKKTT